MIARESACGFTTPVARGVTPGSGPGHLALFGYDPLVYNIGRGALEAIGIDFDLQPSDIAARGNFCTVDGEGRITDRRAGRISTETCTEIVAERQRIPVDGAQLFVEPVREHRFVFALRGEGLSEDVSDTDPQAEGVMPLTADATFPAGNATAARVNRFVEDSRSVLKEKHPANALLLRGSPNALGPYRRVFKLRPAAVAHSMYRA
jgi:2,3-bisphosphoglycerate-independent phosphoglycerate mutase